jgi:hypothetical protein
MQQLSKKMVAGLAASSAAAVVGVVGIASAATTSTTRQATPTTASTTPSSGKATKAPSNETELTGDVAAQAKAAALTAVPGGTVERASTEDPADASGAAYEVHVTKSDGSRVEVLLDASFKVLSTKADDHGPGRG